MNTIGIDFQRCSTVVHVREGERTVAVGDGLRSHIPTAIAEPNLFGSAAMLKECGIRFGDDPTRGEPWPSRDAATEFFRGLRERLRLFLGRVEPSRACGYGCIVSAEGLTDARFEASLRDVIRSAGFDNPVLLPATDALFARWLRSVDRSENAKPPRTVVVVAVGDTRAEIVVRSVEADAFGFIRSRVASRTATIKAVGHASCQERIMREIDRCLKEPLPTATRPVLHDAIVEFALRLSSRTSNDGLWNAPFRDRMYAPPSFTRSDVDVWSEARILRDRLPATIDEVLLDAGRSRADLLVLGGWGACWPHVEVAVGDIALIWTSADPTNDVALGAAWWPMLSERHGGTATTDREPTPGFEPVSSDFDEVPTQPDDLIAPWDRCSISD